MSISTPEFRIPDGFDTSNLQALTALVDEYVTSATAVLKESEAALQVELDEKTSKYEYLYEVAGNEDRLGLVWPWAPDRSQCAEQLRRGEIPILQRVRDASTLNAGIGAADNIIIEGDNLPGLMAYLASGAPKADIMYIDPVYNTGGDLTYGDKLVEKDDPKYHSAWLSMMLPRLVLLKAGLRETGVAAVSIGNDEHGHLRLLMDRVFGGKEFMSHVTWAGSVKNDARDFSNTSDYTMFYYKNKRARMTREVESGTARPGVEDMKKQAEELFKAAIERFGDGEEARVAAENAFKKWFKTAPDAEDARSFAGNAMYLNLDAEGNIFRGDNLSWPGGGGPKYIVKNPHTGDIVRIPKRGWLYSQETFWELYDKGRILFNGKTIPQYKRYIEEVDEVKMRDIVFKDRGNANRELNAQLGLGPDGKAIFDYPKDREVLALWFDYVVPEFRKRESAKDPIVVIDFFAGSGSTGLAVLDLDAPKPEKDKEEWRFVLITNDEPVRKNSAFTISRDVTAKRLQAYVTGEWDDGKEHDSFNANVHFYETKLVALTDNSEYASLSTPEARSLNDAARGSLAAELMQHKFAGCAAVGMQAHWPVREDAATLAFGNEHAASAFADQTVELLRGPDSAIAIWQNYRRASEAFGDGDDADPSGIMRDILASQDVAQKFAFVPSADNQAEFTVDDAVTEAYPTRYIDAYRSFLKLVSTAGRFGQR